MCEWVSDRVCVCHISILFEVYHTPVGHACEPHGCLCTSAAVGCGAPVCHTPTTHPHHPTTPAGHPGYQFYTDRLYRSTVAASGPMGRCHIPGMPGQASLLFSLTPSITDFSPVYSPGLYCPRGGWSAVDVYFHTTRCMTRCYD